LNCADFAATVEWWHQCLHIAANHVSPVGSEITS